ncbi:MAG: acetyl-CoA carboxylase biotin carboxylase subunit [Clostridiales bacterium]|nr:acetyl-CoA carboxylase biotin carboxylase subunit [Clostridiales bacterium]
MYKKILVANRGEIAVRILRACRDMGIRTVAVYSEADKDAYHLDFADEAYPIGPAPASESYLNVSALIDVASRAQVDAIHPGYGFLSENAYFAAVCRTWGIDFIGPDPSAIQRMGDKAQARRLVKEAGVPVMPGSDDALEDLHQAREVAERIGYPVLVKAAGGGGGRGIRVVERPQDLEQALESAAREAANAFGTPEVYVEKYIPNPRHVEIQILADSHGRTISLYERDSSIQRRRQKLIEESPSPFLDEDLRWAMSQAAIRVAQAVRYKNAGTVEFLVDQDGSFYFIEMNTRLQVEHPVTEAILGVDIVQEQIRIAMGQALSWRQEDLKPRGSAIEFRINAEDPFRGFIPSPGKVEFIRWPMGPGVRVDEGVVSGHVIHPYYDSLMGKLIVWGADREEALRRAERALAELEVEGIRTTVPLYRELVRHPDFQRGTYHTRWLEEVFMAHLPR